MKQNWRSFLFSGWFQLPKVSPLEGLFSRLLFGAVLLYSLRVDLVLDSEPHPVGLLDLLRFWDPDFTLTWLSDNATFDTYRWWCVLAVVIYISGFALPLVLPVLAILHILPFTLFNSQGYTHHGYQILSLTLVAQACTAIFAAIRQGKAAWLLPNDRFRSWLLIQAQVIVTGSYLISVVTKMDESDGKWLLESNYVALDMVKTQRQSYLNHLDPKYLDAESDAVWLMERPGLARLLFGSGFMLETLCVLAIGNRALGLLFGVALIIMHRSIDILMGLNFLNNELMCLLFLIGLPFGLAWCFEQIRSPVIRRGLVAGILLSIPFSDFFLIEAYRITTTLPTFRLPPLDIIQVWGKWQTDHFLRIVAPLIKAAACCTLVTLAVSALISRWSRQSRGNEVVGP